jgi:hypothetical protein
MASGYSLSNLAVTVLGAVWIMSTILIGNWHAR